MPDQIYVPVGNGTLLLGLYIGFKQLVTSGVINKIPELIAVQAENCSPVYDDFYKEHASVKYRSSIADGIAVQSPIRLKQIVQAVRETKGKVIKVNEEEIKQAYEWMLSENYPIEATASVVFAALQKEKTFGMKILTFITGRK
jgi:threonine synthase